MKTLQYQQDTLANLRAYLALARTTTAAEAFKTATAGLPPALRRAYVPLADDIVSTLATARVDKTEQRKVYDHNENLKPFFNDILDSTGGPGAPRTAGLERRQPASSAASCGSATPWRDLPADSQPPLTPFSYPKDGGRPRPHASQAPIKFSWHLGDPAAYPAILTPVEFSTEVESKRYELRIENNRVVDRYLGAQMTLDLKHMEEPWSEDHLIAWLVEHIEDANTADRQDVTNTVLRDYVRRTVRYLTAGRALTLADLQRYAFSLHKAIDQKIRRHRETAFQRGFQQFLALPETEVATSFDHPFHFSVDGYMPRSYYQGTHQFNNHFYPVIGAFDSDEEYDCAVAIDECPAIEYWVRNLDYGPTAFNLPIPSHRFFPDFAAQLKDGRRLLVEYKGDQLEGKASEQAKRDIGRAWETHSAGRALFLWAVLKDPVGRDVTQQLKACLLS